MLSHSHNATTCLRVTAGGMHRVSPSGIETIPRSQHKGQAMPCHHNIPRSRDSGWSTFRSRSRSRISVQAHPPATKRACQRTPRQVPSFHIFSPGDPDVSGHCGRCPLFTILVLEIRMSAARPERQGGGRLGRLESRWLCFMQSTATAATMPALERCGSWRRFDSG
jgi:hypothetical protein